MCQSSEMTATNLLPGEEMEVSNVEVRSIYIYIYIYIRGSFSHFTFFLPFLPFLLSYAQK